MAIIDVVIAAKQVSRGVYDFPDVDYNVLGGDFDYTDDAGSDSYGVDLGNWPDGLLRTAIAARLHNTRGTAYAYTTTGFVNYTVSGRQHVARATQFATTIYDLVIAGRERRPRGLLNSTAATVTYTASNWNQDYVAALTNAAKIDPAIAAMLKDTKLTIDQLIEQIQTLKSSGT